MKNKWKYALAAIMLVSSVAVFAGGQASATSVVHKSYVCKYTHKPGTDTEVLQTGQNPIWVDNHSLTGKDNSLVKVGDTFSDRHGKSVVIVANTPKLNPEPGIDQCPGYVPPTTTTVHCQQPTFNYTNYTVTVPCQTTTTSSTTTTVKPTTTTSSTTTTVKATTTTENDCHEDDFECPPVTDPTTSTTSTVKPTTTTTTVKPTTTTGVADTTGTVPVCEATNPQCGDGSFPVAGSNTGPMSWLAFGLLVGGFLMLLSARRKSVA